MPRGQINDSPYQGVTPLSHSRTLEGLFDLTPFKDPDLTLYVRVVRYLQNFRYVVFHARRREVQEH